MNKDEEVIKRPKNDKDMLRVLGIANRKLRNELKWSELSIAEWNGEAMKNDINYLCSEIDRVFDIIWV